MRGTSPVPVPAFRVGAVTVLDIFWQTALGQDKFAGDVAVPPILRQSARRQVEARACDLPDQQF